MVESLGSVCRLDEAAVEALLLCVDAVLSLGEVAFTTVAHATADDACRVKDSKTLDAAAAALGCDRALLESGFTQRTIGTSTTALSAEQAGDARDALAKELYSRLFDRVVELSNATTRHDTSTKHGVVIGMLDLFGFEFYGAAGSTNGFEQLLINFANERLQQRFVADVLARAQRELLAEGVPWTRVDYDDNAEVLRLIESRGGLLDILNEECVRGNSGNDVNFVAKLLTNHKDHGCLSTPKIRISDAGAALPFTVQHYAGAVLYRCTDKAAWVERNRDVLPAKLVEAMTTPADGAERANASLSPVAVFGAAEALAMKKQRERARAGGLGRGAANVGTPFSGDAARTRVAAAAAPFENAIFNPRRAGGRARRRGSQFNAQETVGAKFGGRAGNRTSSRRGFLFSCAARSRRDPEHLSQRNDFRESGLDRRRAQVPGAAQGTDATDRRDEMPLRAVRATERRRQGHVDARRV